MKASLLILVSISLAAADFYSSRYDDFDVQPLLENERTLKNYIKCFLDEGPCTPDAKDFKKVIPEAVETTCGKCTHKQRILIRKVIRAVMEKHPKAWQELVDRYDPDRKYQDGFNKFLASEE